MNKFNSDIVKLIIIGKWNFKKCFKNEKKIYLLYDYCFLLIIIFGFIVIIIFINIIYFSFLFIFLKEKWSEWIWGKNLYLRLSIDIRKDGEGGD